MKYSGSDLTDGVTLMFGTHFPLMMVRLMNVLISVRTSFWLNDRWTLIRGLMGSG